MSENWLVPELPVSFIRAQGVDTDSFLQGQFSNDIRLLTPERGQLSSFNSAKGRMLAVLHLFRIGDTVLIELNAGVLDSVLKRLRLFVLRSKVHLEAAGASVAAIGVCGPSAAAVLAEAGLPVPGEALATGTQGGVAVIRRHGNLPRYSLIGSAAEIEALRQALAARLPVEGAAMWRRLDIEAGLPTIYPGTQDHFVPQWCNLDQLGGISFSKGCYTGQEVVARVHYLGAVKRRMALVQLAGEAPTPGAKLAAPAGEAVDAVQLSAGGSLALVVTTADANSQ